MSFIDLSESKFSIIPEGTHIFRIDEVSYDETFKKLKIRMITENNQVQVQTYNFLKRDGSTNDGARNMFSYLARVTMNDNTLRSIDPTALVGKFVEAEVKHNKVESTTEAGKILTFVQLGSFKPADGFSTSPAMISVDDIDDLLG